MKDFDRELERRLDELRQQGLSRSLRRIDSHQGTKVQIAGKWLLNFSSNDYLGLANDERLKEAALEAINQYGTGSGASRLICGSLAPHHELEEALAAFKNCGAALAFSSGYATALGTIRALLEKEDVIILDKLVHASIVDAARLSGAKIRIFAHNDLNELEDILKSARAGESATRRPKTLIVTESVFSMDGGLAPLAQIVELKEKYGAWLMLDEAHSTGLYGVGGAGLASQLGLGNQIEIQMGTLGKALGAAGGYICGSRVLIEFLINRARSFIFSTAMVPAASAAATAAIQLVQTSEGERRRKLLWERVAEVARLVDGNVAEPASAILPMVIGDEAAAMGIAAALFGRGIFIPGIRYPSVPRGQARLRITVTADHTSEQVRTLGKALEELTQPSGAAAQV